MLERFGEKGWVKARGIQRTDSTHVLSAVRALNRIEIVGETIRAALNALAVAAPEWLRERVPEDWFARYGRPVYDELPKGVAARREYAESVGKDGTLLLSWIATEDSPKWLREIPADLLVMCATYGWSYADKKRWPRRPITRMRTA